MKKRIEAHVGGLYVAMEQDPETGQSTVSCPCRREQPAMPSLNKLTVGAYSEPGGRVSLRLFRRRTDDPEADSAPLVMEHGVFEFDLNVKEMREIHDALTGALWERLK